MWATMESVRGDRLMVSLPAGIHSRPVAGRFFLARTCDGGPSDRSWTTYLRRVLRPLRIEARGGTSHWTLLPDRVSAYDPGRVWLQAHTPGDRIEILGPYG